MTTAIHLARLDCPSAALRVVCGAWREASNWTTVPALATCPGCRARAGLPSEPPPTASELGGAAPPRPPHRPAR